MRSRWNCPRWKRVRLGFLAALNGITPNEDTTARRRVALAARLPELRGALALATLATHAVVAKLLAQGADGLDAAAVTAACLGALTAALLVWPERPAHTTLDAVVGQALHHLAPGGLS